MTDDDHDPREESDAASAGAFDEDAVSRLLAQAGGAEPPPSDVQARLDETLAALVRERDAHVVPLRRESGSPWGRRLLVAAAVLGVVGVGGGLAGALTGALDPSGSEDASVGAAEESSGDSGDGTVEPRTGLDAGGSALQRATDLEDEAALRRAVRTLLGPEAAAAGPDAPKGDRPGAGSAAACAVPRVEGARTAVVRYAGRDAVLVARRLDATLEGRVYDCDLGLLLDGVRIPASSGPVE